MTLEEAQDLIDTADGESEGINCDFCPFTSEVGCTTEASCSGVTAQAARLIIADKDARIAALEKQLTFRKEEDEIIRSMLQKQEAEIREYREKYEIAQDECVRLQTENDRMHAKNFSLRNCYNCDGHDICGCENYYDCNTGCGQGDISYWKPKETK